MNVEINGISHLVLTVNRLKVCGPFYESLLTLLGMKEAYKGENMHYYVGGRTGVAIQQCAGEFKDEKFEQARIGLHHV
jgi:hypothetical protein